METALSVRHLSKTFYSGFFAPIPKLRERDFGRVHRVVRAVSDVSFEIAPGSFVGLAGPTYH